jgi:hypothetical protein
MKLICISNKVYVHPFDKDDEEEYSYKLWKYITTNKEYDCIEVICDDYGNPEEYRIIADDGREGNYPIENFTTKWKIRNDKLNKLGI